MKLPEGSAMRTAAVFTAAGALVAAGLTPQLDDHFVELGAPLPRLCELLAAAAAIAAILPLRWGVAREVTNAAIGALRLAIPMVLMLTWKVNGREFWGALVVWVAIYDAWRGVTPRAPLAPAALAITGVVLWTGDYLRVAPGMGVLVGLVAGTAAAWGAERRAERSDGPAHPRAP